MGGAWFGFVGGRVAAKFGGVWADLVMGAVVWLVKLEEDIIGLR